MGQKKEGEAGRCLEKERGGGWGGLREQGNYGGYQEGGKAEHQGPDAGRGPQFPSYEIGSRAIGREGEWWEEALGVEGKA